MVDRIKIGLVGCGNISPAYVKGCRRHDNLEIVACADVVLEKAMRLAEEYQIPRATTVETLLADPEIRIAVNLTVPVVHAEVSQAIIKAGKHVYSEKPLALSRAEGLKLLDAAEKKGLRVGCAPDTFLGSGQQNCRHLIDQGRIGRPVGATAFMMSAGPESWHPNPGFFYQKGGGPLFDMGPYYLTALVNLLGPVARVTGTSRITFSERIATSPQRDGERLSVEVPTHVAALLEFVEGPVGVMVTSFDVQGSSLPRIEVYGSDGTLSAPDPNMFEGPVKIIERGHDSWSTGEQRHEYRAGRGVGVADMARAIAEGQPHRASGDLAYHVLEIMRAIEEASQSGRHVNIKSRCEQPQAVEMRDEG